MDEGAELVARAQRGDPQALTRLVEAVTPTLRTYIRRRVGERLGRFVSLSDLEQEVLLQGTRSLDRMAPGATLEDFQALLQVHAGWAIGKSVRSYENAAGESRAQDGVVRAREEGASMGSVTRADEVGWLHERIDALEEPQREIVLLRMQGVTFVEIATQLELSEDQVRRHFVRAAARIRR